jgi:uncharacterized protein YjbI with pentapeptide repeats
MIIPPIRWLGSVAVAVAAVAALALPWALSRAWFWSRLIGPWDSRTVIVVAVDAALVLVAAIWWLWWRLPKRQVRKLDIQIHDPKDRAETEDNFRKTVGQALGGAAVLIGAVAAYLQFTQQQQASRAQLLASRDLLISNQVSKGFEQLAGEKLEMRLGGIYALEGVMNTSAQYHQAVLEALCGFVRNRAKEDKAASNSPTADIHPPATDIQAAITVIGRRSDGLGRVDLAGAYLGNAELSDAKLGGANLSSVNLTVATLLRADLSNASLDNATLVAAHMTGANMTGAKLYGAKLTGVSMNRANLTGAYLYGTDLSGADLSRADLSGVDLTNANLNGAHLSGANLRGAYLSDAKLIQANLTDAELMDASLIGAELMDAILISAKLIGVKLTAADLTRTSLFRADLTGADLTGVKNLDQAQLDEACGKPKVLPRGLTLDRPCPKKPAAPAASQKGTP